ncbi:hypothetical protein SBOR_5319 [Sclerotinia borealis F-4128]|uniref:Uncharacterized protein n=1 Tax=Sclerotinia borealis (strain F-4128) TaxID=1432307 RepID=W9CEN6_SCLBF|nr:hypothetical protein SBOR_5319 [Sclerotinia borealis F-4128]
MSDTYKPTEHKGLKEDGTPDKRVGTGEFAYGQVDPVTGAKTGQSEETSETTSGSGSGSSKGEFAHGKVDPVEAGKKGGQAS